MIVKTYIALGMTLLTFVSGSLQAASIAQTRMYCLSIQFNRSSAGGPNALYSLDFTGVNAGINGELYPIFGQSRSHRTFLIVTDNLFDGKFYGTLLLDVPETDADGDGFPDIFDTAKAFNGGSSGSYSGFGNGAVAATWSREADSHVGFCQLNFQNFGSFTHTFHILEYRGPLTYTPGTNVVMGHVDLKLTGSESDELKGPIALTKWEGDPFNELDYEDGVWTNSLSETPATFSFLGDTLFRDAPWPTNYYGYFEFDDWLPSTAEPDYYLWFLSIDDLNDADGDGIPDLSDDPQIVAPRRPLLALARTESNVQLTISGDIGQVCDIQQKSTIDAVSWLTISSVTLTNNLQTVSLPLPSAGTAFWRVNVQ